MYVTYVSNFFIAVQSKRTCIAETEAAPEVQGGIRVLLKLDREVGHAGKAT